MDHSQQIRHFTLNLSLKKKREGINFFSLKFLAVYAEARSHSCVFTDMYDMY